MLYPLGVRTSQKSEYVLSAPSPTQNSTNMWDTFASYELTLSLMEIGLQTTSCRVSRGSDLQPREIAQIHPTERSSRMTRFSGVVCLMILQSCSAFAPTKPCLQQRNFMSTNSDLEPVTDKMQTSSTIKKAGAAAAVFGLIFGKKFLDGPGIKLSCSLTEASAALNCCSLLYTKVQ
jgi:hypothetical protein